MKNSLLLTIASVAALGMTSCNGLKQNQADNSQSNGYYQQGQAYDPYAQDSVQVTEYGGQTQQQQNPYGQYQGQQDYGQQYQQPQQPAYQNPYPQPTYQQPYPQQPTYDTGATAASGRSHTVVKGDTLFSLSRRYGTSVSAIKQQNGLVSDTIKIGQVLALP